MSRREALPNEEPSYPEMGTTSLFLLLRTLSPNDDILFQPYKENALDEWEVQ